MNLVLKSLDSCHAQWQPQILFMDSQPIMVLIQITKDTNNNAPSSKYNNFPSVLELVSIKGGQSLTQVSKKLMIKFTSSEPKA